MVDNELSALSYSILGFTSSVSSFHSLTESNQKLLQALHSHVALMHSQPSPVQLGRFNGYNAVGWILLAELYFDSFAISDAHKLHYVSYYFDGDALEWFHWMYRNNQLVDWKHFKEQVVCTYGYTNDQVVSFADLNILPTYYAIESTSKVGNSNEEQVFNEMPLAEDSPFSSANGSEGHSDLEDEISEKVCDIQAKFEGSMGDYLNIHLILLTIAHAYSPISTLFLCPMSPDNSTNLNLQVRSFLLVNVVDAWVDIGQLCDSLSYVAETPHKFSTILERYPYVWNRSSQQLFDSMSQTCHYSKVFAENSQGEAIGVTLTLDSSLHRCLSFHAFHAILTMKFGVNQVAAIADKSLLFTLEFEEAFNLTFSILRAYDHSILAYHCIHKSKAMALISHTSSHDNAFTKLFVVVYAMVQVELDRNFSMSVSRKTPIQLLGSHLAMVESAKRISKYGMLMKLVAVFEELV
ncbi:hypothetical protein KY290_013462 [Solanum tuberosum]|uniref:Uncharacterized protein n=1 Tax=Solanum tuberosum TaxID=4113 RepID=A0ABQ7VLT2_SOLTU|nr:hypothetical protein KY289_013582 [Solanum tuberosum]KAH0716890.1 hypothetical protein KY285_012921 [Solanum tuberosum]KAH0769481.1 hypothetical protein KY290_013462 [Solanum tuberosum]